MYSICYRPFTQPALPYRSTLIHIVAASFNVILFRTHLSNGIGSSLTLYTSALKEEIQAPHPGGVGEVDSGGAGGCEGEEEGGEEGGEDADAREAEAVREVGEAEEEGGEGGEAEEGGAGEEGEREGCWRRPAQGSALARAG